MAVLDLHIVPDVLGESPLCTVAADTSVSEAARRMREADARSVVVTDAAGRLLGLVSERDIVHRLVAEARNPRTTRVDAIMNAHPDLLAPTDLAVDALDLMDIRAVDCLPVMDGPRILGVVTMVDLCEAMRREVEQALQAEHETVFGPEGTG